MKKEFLPTYLYIKTHKTTGLKYFGKTTTDPYNYYGSGIYWLAHLHKYGFTVDTEIVGYYTIKDECVQAALTFSTIHNIVSATNAENKKIWANLIIENGLDGGATKFGPHTDLTKSKISAKATGRHHTEDTKQKIRDARKLQDMSHMAKPKTEEHKEKIRKTNTGKMQSTETKLKRSESLRGHIVTDETRQKLREANIGKIISPETIQKLRNCTRTEEQKQHLRNINLGKTLSDETKQKLSGMVCVVDKQGDKFRITKEQYYSQTGPKIEWEWVSHKSKEAMLRR